MVENGLSSAGAVRGVRPLTDDSAVQLMESIGLRVPRKFAVRTAKDAIEAAHSIGRPVALKLDSSRVTHKSDVGGVILSVSGERDVREGFRRLTAIARSIDSIQPVLVTIEPMARPGVELILGVVTDELFGRSLMLGFGGVFVELLEDISFRLLPLSSADACDMVASLRAQRLLAGYRGVAGVDVGALCHLVVRLSEAVERDGSIHEMEFNPIIASGSSFTAVDWNILVED